MKLDFPTEIFDRAVEISCTRATQDTKNLLDVELKEHMEASSVLDLSQVPFFKMIYCSMLQVHETIWSENMQFSRSRHVLNFELARVFKSLP